MPNREPRKYDVSTFIAVVDRMSGELKKIADILVPDTPIARDIGKPIAGGPKQWNHPYAQYARGTDYELLFQKIHLLNKDVRALATAVDNSPEATQYYRAVGMGSMEDMVETSMQAAKAACENYLTRGIPDLYACVGKLLAGKDGLSLLVSTLAGVVNRITDYKHSETLARLGRGGFWPASESNDPRAIANLLSEDINVNDGFLIESEYDPVPGVRVVLNKKESQEIGYSDVNGGMMSYVIFLFEIDIHGRKQSGEIKIYLLNDEYNGHEDPSVRLDEEQMDYLLEALEDELEGESL